MSVSKANSQRLQARKASHVRAIPAYNSTTRYLRIQRTSILGESFLSALHLADPLNGEFGINAKYFLFDYLFRPLPLRKFPSLYFRALATSRSVQSRTSCPPFFWCLGSVSLPA